MKPRALLPIIFACLLTAACGGTDGEAGAGVRISPRSATIQVGRSWTFSASVEDSSDRVRWTAGRGSITSDGEYTAPNSAGPDWVEATSERNSDLFDRVGVTVID